jgi:TorA maturation chaperone TorD
MQTASVAQTIEELLARSAVYRALSALLRHPTPCDVVEDGLSSKRTRGAAWRRSRRAWGHRLPEVLERFEGNGHLPAAPAAAAQAGMSGQARRLLKVLDAATLPDLMRQHERIFGHTVQGSAPPYELEYGEEHSHRQPQELGDIAAFYAAFGLTIATSAHERVDHVGTECEFLHYLLYKQACAVDADAHEQAEVCGDAARRFLADHLGRWGPAFALRLTRVAGDDWLGVVGELLLGWLSQECARMNVPLGSRDLPLRAPKEQDEGCAACLRI